MKEIIIVFIIVAIIWALIAFQKKILLKDFNFLEVGFGNFSVVIVLVILLYSILILCGKFTPRRVLNMNKNQALRFALCGSLIWSGGLGINYLLTNNDATKIIPMVKAGIIITTLVLGCLFYNELITFKKVIASLFAIIAIIILFDEKSNTPK